MGFEKNLSDPRFQIQMLVDMDGAHSHGHGHGVHSYGDGDDHEGHGHGDGEVSADEFVEWYLRKGAFILEKPRFATLELSVPPMEERGMKFKALDADGSGDLDYKEVKLAMGASQTCRICHVIEGHPNNMIGHIGSCAHDHILLTLDPR